MAQGGGRPICRESPLRKWGVVMAYTGTHARKEKLHVAEGLMALVLYGQLLKVFILKKKIQQS